MTSLQAIVLFHAQYREWSGTRYSLIIWWGRCEVAVEARCEELRPSADSGPLLFRALGPEKPNAGGAGALPSGQCTCNFCPGLGRLALLSFEVYAAVC